MPARYEEVAAELRGRIASGALAAGARLPSVRAVARRWRVAPGTAVKALQVLVREGVARPVARSSYRVVGPSSRGEPELSRERIVEAAIRLADQRGLAALSIRSLAEELSASPMALYRHVESKDALVGLMVDAALGSEPLPEVRGLGWRKGLERAYRQEWRVMQRHPWLARALSVSRPGAQPNALAFADRVFAALEATRLGAADRLKVHTLLHNFVQGMGVNAEAEAQAFRESGKDEAAYMREQEQAFAAVAASGRLPAFARVITQVPAEVDMSLDALFEHGLRVLLDGLSVQPGLRRRRRGRG